MVGNVLGGRLCDRCGPALVLMTGPLLFALGLVVAGSAHELTQLLIGRALQGVGGVAQVVALYVMIAMVFPARDRPVAFGALSAAWVVPALLVLLPKGRWSSAPACPAWCWPGACCPARSSAARSSCRWLQQVHGFSPALAGVPLTVAALGWSAASWWQARHPDLFRPLLMRRGFPLITLGLVLVTFVAPVWGRPWLAAPAWVFAGMGMGLAVSSVSVLVLKLSPEQDRGFNSAALQLSDLFGRSVFVGLGGVLVALLGPTLGWSPLNAVLAVCTLFAAVVLARRAASHS